MRKGSRWRSIEMAGIVTKTGADIITQARILVEQIGRPLELDTDGIWCILPGSFPDVYSFVAKDGSTLKLEYPCLMLNADVHDKFTNHQYQTAVDAERGVYEARSECSIFFEVDGPYRCMVLPASTEEGKLLKKRYAVFNIDGSLAELKGFELKRRGELELIKTFQSQVFARFLDGTTLKECYDCVADVANHWIDVIDTRGDCLEDDELVDLISENRNMSRQLEDYGGQKGTSQTTARRLSEFLGAEIIKDKGLNCKFVIAEQPFGAPVTERAIPTAIWKAEPAVMKHFLRKWLKAPGLDGESLDIRNVLDWNYYLDRLAKTIQKIITIPAALQKIPNPVPRIIHPKWLESKVNRMNDKLQQKNIRSMFGVTPETTIGNSQSRAIVDIEDMANRELVVKCAVVHKILSPSDKVQSDDQCGEILTNFDRVRLSKEAFGEWLTQKKSLWKQTRKDCRLLNRGGNEKKQRTAIDVDDFVREATLTRTEKEWQVLEVREMSSYESNSTGKQSGSGDFIVWVMVGSTSLQKVTISVPRTLYIAAKKEIVSSSHETTALRQVEKHLPYNKRTSFLYEVTMSESFYKSNDWIKSIFPKNPGEASENVFETIYESGTPLMTRILTEMGSIAKLHSSATNKKTYGLADIVRVDRPSAGEYLHKELSYKRLILYVRINAKTKTGLVALFKMKGGSGTFAHSAGFDITRPSNGSSTASFDVGASCTIWIIKNSKRGSQRSISLKQCNSIFSQLLNTIQEAAGLDSDYACVAPNSNVSVSSLHFVDEEAHAFAGANEFISSLSKTNYGATLILLNSSRPTSYLRRYMSTFSLFPVISMPFPPGPAHDPDLSTLPSLNWEQPLAQLSLEAFLFLVVISFPKRVSYCRYGHVPLGNLGKEENTIVYEISLSRLIQKNRALSWASFIPGRPDVGVDFIPNASGGCSTPVELSRSQYNRDEIWGDDNELVSPIIRRPGCYRSICVDIDIQDLAIAALTDTSQIIPVLSGNGCDGGFLQHHELDQSSPTSVAIFEGGSNFSKVTGPLGNEMSTAISLPIVRALVNGWLRDALVANSFVADELLHHIYRLLSNPDTVLHDPALHRVVHSLMKSTFLRLLGNLEKLGCSIVFASFHKITISTNKLQLADAEEYINFVIETAKHQTNNSDQGDSVTKVSLCPRQFHSNFVFLDEFNFGTMHLERLDQDEIDDTMDFVIPDSEDLNLVVVPSVVTAWSLMNYLGSETAQEYFRAIIGRFSKEVLRKQIDLASQDGTMPILSATSMNDQILSYKRKMISKHFASYLTRAVGEILKEGPDDHFVSPLMSDRWSNANIALEFVKNVVAVLELDTDLENEVHILKRTLLAQVGIAEYAKAAQWVNPCPEFILPDVLCSECHDSRDVNLCYIPPYRDGEEVEKYWSCEDCGTPYSVPEIESRLMHRLHIKTIRYALQDVRCTKTNRVASRALAPLSDCSAGLKLDISRHDAEEELRMLYRLAELHELETLQESISKMLRNYN